MKPYPISPELLEFLAILHKNGYQSYLAYNKKQIDQVITNASLQQVVQLYHQVLHTSSKQGGITVIFWQLPIEVYSYTTTLYNHARSFFFSFETLFYDWAQEQWLDFFQGEEAENAGLIRTIGDPDKLFLHHPLVMMEAVSFAACSNYALESDLLLAGEKHSHLLSALPQDLIRDHLVQIILAKKPSPYFAYLQQMGIIAHFLPELEKAFAVWLTPEHNLGQHTLRMLDHLPRNLNLRLAGLFHDLGKLAYTNSEDTAFFDHEEQSAIMAKKILDRLNLFLYIAGQNINHHHVLNLIRNHMFSYDVKQTTKKGIQRLISRVGLEQIEDLILMREANILAGSISKQGQLTDCHVLKKSINAVLGKE